MDLVLLTEGLQKDGAQWETKLQSLARCACLKVSEYMALV